MIEMDVYNEETGEHINIRIWREDLGYKYLIDVENDEEFYQKDGTIYHVDALSTIDLTKLVLGTLDG